MSCVLRTHERYGSAYVIDVLMGAQNTRIMQNGDDSLSTYGIGRDLSKKDWNAIKELINYEAETLPIEVLTDLMRILVEKDCI